MTTHHGSPSFAAIISVLSIALYCAGFLRFEFELNLQKNRINALENAAEKSLPTKVDQNLRKLMDDVSGTKYSADVYKEFPADWFQGLNIKTQVTSSVYRSEVNTYKVKCGGSLEMWESSGWIHKQDPYGWFQWYCRFYEGRRTEDDSRQVDRWKKCAGDKGRWRNNLIAKIVRSGCAYDNFAVSPVVRQTLQHWGYKLNKEDFDKYAKKVKL